MADGDHRISEELRLLDDPLWSPVKSLIKKKEKKVFEEVSPNHLKKTKNNNDFSEKLPSDPQNKNLKKQIFLPSSNFSPSSIAISDFTI